MRCEKRMITLYYVQDKRNKWTSAENGLLLDNKEKLEDIMKGLSDGFVSLYDNDRYEIKTIEVNEKCKCSNYMQTEMILIEVEKDGNIKMIGSDNYIGIHEKVRLNFDVNIESYTNGINQLMSDKYFNDHYKIEKK